MAHDDGRRQPGGQPQRLGRIRAITPGRDASGGACPEATCLTVAFDGDYAPWRDVFSVSGGNYILPEHVLAGADFDTVWNTGGIIGSGPYTLESFDPGVRAVLARDPDYWGPAPAGGAPPIDRIVVDFLASPAAALAAVRQGEAQMASPPPDPDLIRTAREIEGARVQSVPSLFFEHVILNTARAPLDDARGAARPRPRDRPPGRSLTSSSTAGCPCCRASCAPSSSASRRPSRSTTTTPPRRPRSSRRRAGGAAATASSPRTAARCAIPLAFDSGNRLRLTTARLMAEQARAAGIVLQPRALSPERIFGSDLVQGDFSALMAAFGGGVDPSVTGLLASDQIPTEENGFSGQNVYRWSDPEADSLMRRSDRQVDDAERIADARPRPGDRGRAGAADPALPAAEHRRVHRGADGRPPEPHPGGGVLEQWRVVARGRLEPGRGGPCAR